MAQEQKVEAIDKVEEVKKIFEANKKKRHEGFVRASECGAAILNLPNAEAGLTDTAQLKGKISGYIRDFPEDIARLSKWMVETERLETQYTNIVSKAKDTIERYKCLELPVAQATPPVATPPAAEEVKKEVKK